MTDFPEDMGPFAGMNDDLNRTISRYGIVNS